jgi:ATP-dependent RNA helicase DOB1
LYVPVRGLANNVSVVVVAITQDTARRIAKLKLDAKLAIDEDDYVGSFCPALMKVTYEWCKGAKFSDIMKLTEMCADFC